MAIYKVILNGECQGQDIKNILWYRNGIGIDLSGLTVGGTVEVANAVKATIWPLLKEVMQSIYTLQDISVYVFDESTFNLLYQNPTILGVQEQGMQHENMNGPAVCGIMKFSLEPTSILVNGPKPPKKGYLAIGPLNDDQVKDDGELNLTGGYQAVWNGVCFGFANNIETLLPPAVFFPIRVHHDKVLGVWNLDSFSDIRDASMRTQTSFRRSRMPES